MAWYWWLLELSAILVEAIMLVYFIQIFSEPRYYSKWLFPISVIAVFSLNTAAYLLKLQIPLNLMFYAVIGIALGFLAFKGNVLSRLLLPVLIIAFLSVTEVLTMGILQLTFQNDYIAFSEQTPFRMLGIIISKVFFIILIYAAGRFSKKEQAKIPLIFGMGLMLVPLISVVCMIAIGQYVFHPSDETLSPIWFAFSSFGLLFLNLLIIYVFEAVMKYSQNQNRLQLMVQQSDMLNKHLRETNALQEETQKIWHDMKNHFTVIQWMVKSRNYEKLENYMNTLNEAVTSSMPKYQSGNPILDALLNTKATEAKNSGIELQVSAAVPSKLSIEDLDLNVVISNALDNAIEACRKLAEGQERFVNIDISIKNDHLVLTVKNPYDGIVRISGNSLQTTKTDTGRHGIGMGNMKRAVEKYDGHILTSIEDNFFILSAIMYCKC